MVDPAVLGRAGEPDREEPLADLQPQVVDGQIGGLLEVVARAAGRFENEHRAVEAADVAAAVVALGELVLVGPGAVVDGCVVEDFVLFDEDRERREVGPRRVSGLGLERVAVNLSPRQFQQQDIVTTVCSALLDSGLDTGQLELEITESAVMYDSEQTTEALNYFREMGVRIAIDDFGTGYSSLIQLKKFPIIPCDLCGSQEGLQRNAMKAMLDDIERKMPGRKDTMIRALGNVRPSHLIDRKLFDFVALVAGKTGLRDNADAL